MVEETAAAASSESLQPQQPLVSLRSSSSCCKHLKVAQNNNQVDVDHNPETKVVIEAKVLNKMTSDPDEDDEEVSHANDLNSFKKFNPFPYVTLNFPNRYIHSKNTKLVFKAIYINLEANHF